jgi:3-hydroxyacyl-CoA dehydrogenase
MTEIKQVAVLGSGTMGLGIAAVCANAGCKVLLLDLTKESCDAALPKLLAGRSPVIDSEQVLSNISTGSFDSDMEKISECQWICEVVVENLEIKRKVFLDIEKHRANGSIITTNTSGIPLKDIYSGMPDRLQEDIAVTHFFNPAHIMRLVELVAGENTKPEVIDSLANFIGKTLGKGVVYAKDTVNFIGNRIGCTWINTGIHLSEEAIQNKGLTVEVVDALLGDPIGLPATGLYALTDLIGIDVMRNVNLNMDENLPENDFSRQYVPLTPSVQDMYDRGQLGRKTGGGFYKLNRHEDGTKSMEIFDITTNQWRAESPATLSTEESSFSSLFSLDNDRGQLVRDLMSATLCYSADLVPEISNDIVNVDRAMRWGFGWQRGPFQLIDEIGSSTFIDHIKQQGSELPHMLQVLIDANETQFYRENETEFLTTDGVWATVPEE